MKRIQLICLLLAISLVGWAQTEKPNNGKSKSSSFVYATAGVGVPIGGFKKSSFYGYQPREGVAYSMSFQHYFTKHWGLSYNFKTGVYKVGDDINDSMGRDSSSYSSKWRKNTLTIAPTYSVFIGKRFVLDFKLHLGAYWGTTPSFTSYGYHTPEKHLDGFAYGLGLQGRYLLGKRLGLILTTDVIGGKYLASWNVEGGAYLLLGKLH